MLVVKTGIEVLRQKSKVKVLSNLLALFAGLVPWTQGDQILGGGLVAQGHGRTSEPGKHKKKIPSTWEGKKKYDKRRNHLILVGKKPDAQVVP